MIFQHPETSLDPRMTAFDSIIEPMRVQKMLRQENALDEAQRLIDLIGLRMGHMERLPSQLSGGEIQRIVLAASSR